MTEQNDEAINEEVEETTSQEQGAAASDGEHQAQEEDVSKVNWKAANDTMKHQRETIQLMQSQLEALKAERIGGGMTPQQKELFEGREKDDYPTYEEVEKVMKAKEQEFNSTVEELRFFASNPDARNVIEKYGKELDPSVAQALAKSGSWEAAYKACLNSAAYYRDHVSKEKNTAAEKAKENASKPGSASSVGGTGAITEAAKFENMSYDDILALNRKYRMGGN